MDKEMKIGILFAFAAACCSGLSPSLSKLLVGETSPVMTSSMLNLGCGIGLLIIFLIDRKGILNPPERRVRKEDWKKIAAIAVSDMLASMCMMIGLSITAASTAALLNNFETVATAIIAMILLKEVVSKRTWGAIMLITAGSIFLSVEDFSSMTVSAGALLVLLACVFWGFENNFIKMTDQRNPIEVVMLKGLIAGIAIIPIGLCMGEHFPSLGMFLLGMAVGLIVYGFTNVLFMQSQRRLGSAKAATFYGINTFLAAVISCIIFAEMPSPVLIVSAVLMIIGLYLASEKSDDSNHNA